MSYKQLKNIWEDFIASLILLTKVPVSKLRKSEDPPNITKAQWAFPLVGALVGLLVILVISLSSFLGLNATISSLIGFVTGLLVLGTFHENGLANMLDAFAGGFDKRKRPEIVRQSRLGTYGILGLIVYAFLKVSLISSLLEAPGCFLLIMGTYALGRTSMVILRKISIVTSSKSSNIPFLKASSVQVILSILLGVVWFIPISFSLIFISVCIILMFTLGLRYLASNQIGGVSIDVLVASVLIGEIVLLIFFNMWFVTSS